MNNDSTNIINGSDLMLFVNGKTVAFATNHTLNVSADTSEATNKDIKGGWTSATIRKLSWTASTENLYAEVGCGNTYATLFDIMIKKQPVDLIFTVSDSISSQDKAEYLTNEGWSYDKDSFNGVIYKGKGLLTSLDTNAPDGDNATFTAEFTGVSELEMVDPDGSDWSLFNVTKGETTKLNGSAISVNSTDKYYLMHDNKIYMPTNATSASWTVGGTVPINETIGTVAGKPFSKDASVVITVVNSVASISEQMAHTGA